MSIKIETLTIENTKKIRAVSMAPTANGLTVIGGNNGQGKTSVLDAIAWVLGGERFRPTSAQNDKSVLPPMLKIELSNGLIVERKGKNSDLKVTDPSGKKAGQQLLNSFISELALDLPKFLSATNKEKAKMLLQTIGIEEELAQLEATENALYNKRHLIGQIADQKAKFAKEQPFYPEAPTAPISVSELIKQQQEILAKNGENQRLRNRHIQLIEAEKQLAAKIEMLKKQIAELEDNHADLMGQIAVSGKTTAELVDESTAELEENIANAEAINAKVQANIAKLNANAEAEQYKADYDGLTDEITQVRNDKMSLLDSAELPLPGLMVDNGELLYNGAKWDCMSGSEQLRVATAIVRKVNPACGFVLIDKLEQMDIDTMNDFGEWLKSEGLQAIATRVSTGDECSIIISDGIAVEDEQKIYKEGDF